MSDTRDKMIEALDEGLVSADILARFFIHWMNEEEAKDFLQRNELEWITNPEGEETNA